MTLATVPSMPRWPRLWGSLLVCQGAWYACVAGAARGTPAWGMAAVAGSIALQLAGSGQRRRADLALIAVALVTGLAWDTLLAQAHLVSYRSPGPWTLVAPAWILMLWAQLGVLLREPLRWLHGRPVLAALTGALGGPASYAAAERLGACEFPVTGAALAALALGWATLLPLLLALARRLDPTQDSR